jgi:hypothetical protein
MDDREWQPQHIVDERQTPVGAGVRNQRSGHAVAAEGGGQHEVCAEVQRGAAGGDHCTRWSSRLQRAGSSLQRRQ